MPARIALLRRYGVALETLGDHLPELVRELRDLVIQPRELAVEQHHEPHRRAVLRRQRFAVHPDGERNTALIKEDEFETPETIAIIEKNREDRERTVVESQSAPRDVLDRAGGQRGPFFGRHLRQKICQARVVER